MHKPIYIYLAKTIISRLKNLMNSKHNSEYFIVFSGIFDLLGMEQSLKSFDYRQNRWIDLHEKDFYKGIFDELIKLECMTFEKKSNDNYIYSVKVDERNSFNLLPYFVDEESETTLNNIGRRGFAGKLRDDQTLRTEGNIILIFDNNPIATLSSASDSEVLINTISKESLKKEIINSNSEEWFKEFTSLLLNDNLHPHTLNVIDRINILLLINENIDKDINTLISLFNLPLFFFQGECNSKSIQDNYLLFKNISNEKLEKNKMNFYKEVIQTLNFSILPPTISENMFIKVLRARSLHESDIYSYMELTWEKINEILNEQPSTDINTILLKVDNDTYVEKVTKKKNKLDLFFLNKNGLSAIKLSIDGNIITNPNVYLHYYFNDFSKAKVSNPIEGNLTIKFENPDYKSMTIIINKNPNKLNSPIYTARVLLQKSNDNSIIVPDVDVANLDWSDGIYPTVTVEEDLETLSEIDYTFKRITQDGLKELISAKLVDKEEIQDLPDVAKFSVDLHSNIVTNIYVKQKEEHIKNKEFKHLIHFLVSNSKDEGELTENLNAINFDKKKLNGFYFENEFVTYSVEEEFNNLLKEIGYDSINDIYNLILQDKKKVITNLRKEEDDLIDTPWNSSNSEIKELLNKRYEVLKAFEEIYTYSDESNLEKINKFNLFSKEYLEEYAEIINRHPQLIMVDCIEVADVKLFTPFAPVNLAFLVDLWDFIFKSVDPIELTILKKGLLNKIDNFETFKYVKSDSDWFISKKSPAFGWLLYSRENNNSELLNEKYLDDLVFTKIKQLEGLYQSVFQKEGQTLHIAVINPADANYILKGVSKYIDNRIKQELKLPKFHISLVFKNGESVDRYTAFDKLFDFESDKNREIVSNVSYTKITIEDSLVNENSFYHIIFIKDIFDTNKTSPKNMYGFEGGFYDTFFANGFQCHPLRKAIKDESQQTLKHIDYVSFNNYSLSMDSTMLSRKIYNKINKYFVQAFQTQFEPNEHPLRRVRVSLEDIPYEHFNKGFIVTFLDKEIDVDIFNNKKLKEAKKPFLLDFTDFEENIGFNSHRFITITNQKEPFKEIFKMALKEVTLSNDVSDRQIERLFDEVNLLNGFWVLRILDSGNESIVKGMLGTVAASIFMRNSLKDDPKNWHFIISLEEIMGATRNREFKGIKQNYADESQLYCDDLAVISFPKDLGERGGSNVSITLIEIKNSNNVEYVKKGFEQLKDTKKLLNSAYVDVPDKIRSLRHKDIITWLIYHNNKHGIFNSGHINEVDSRKFEKDLHQLIIHINNAEVKLDVNDGVLININNDISSIEKLETIAPNYVYIQNDDYISLLLEPGDTNE